MMPKISGSGSHELKVTPLYLHEMKDEGTGTQGAAVLPCPAEEGQRSLDFSLEPQARLQLDEPVKLSLGRVSQRSRVSLPFVLPSLLPPLPEQLSRVCHMPGTVSGPWEESNEQPTPSQDSHSSGRNNKAKSHV